MIYQAQFIGDNEMIGIVETESAREMVRLGRSAWRRLQEEVSRVVVFWAATPAGMVDYHHRLESAIMTTQQTAASLSLAQRLEWYKQAKGGIQWI